MKFKKYVRTNVAEMYPYNPNDLLSADVSISIPDKANGSPKLGDMIAHDPENHEDKWLINEKYFKENFAPMIGVHDPLDDLFDFTCDNTLGGAHKQNVVADKQLRVELDNGLQKLKRCPRSRERSLAITKLQEAIMWLGMDLKRLNEPNPYPDSYKPENTNIAPTADNMKM